MAKEFSIYVHIPFCVSKCYYCDFNSYANADEHVQKYIDTLILEIQEDNNFENDCICKTIYIGGGTPSHIDSKYIVQILTTIKNKYTLANNVEITIEANPCSLTEDKMKAYLANGINRLSLGLQSTNNELLRKIGRKHTYEEFLEKYNCARKLGFENINVDLILSLPNENISDVENDVNRIIELAPKHISVYSLIIYESTKMFEMLQNNEFSVNDDVDRQMYHLVQNTLKDAGYNQYEISNFSKKGYESKHNVMCWKQYEYLGFGAGASSFVGNMRYKNKEKIQEYILSQDKIIEEKMSQEELIDEYMMLGLRMLEGISKEEFKKKFDVDVNVRYANELKELENDELVLNNDTNIVLTTKGIDLNNYICEKFVQ